MTLDQFNNTQWYKGMKVVYGADKYWVRSVDFQEMLLGILPDFLDLNEAAVAEGDEIIWVRCENCEIIEQSKAA